MPRCTWRPSALRRLLLVGLLAFGLTALVPGVAHAAPLAGIGQAAPQSPGIAQAPLWLPAHSQLQSVTPANGAVLTAPPTQLVLVFNEDVNPTFVQVALTHLEATVSTGAVAVTHGTVTVPVLVDTWPGPGAYRIAYRVVSADGHPVSGSSDFTVSGPTTASAAPTTSAQTTAPPPTGTAVPATPVSGEAGGGSSSEVSAPVVTGVVLALLALVAAVLVWLRRRRGGQPQQGQPR